MKKQVEIVYGTHAVRHVLELNPESILSAWIQDSKKGKNEIHECVNLLNLHAIHIDYLPKSTLDKHTANATHQGIIIKQKSGSQTLSPDLDSIINKTTEGKLFLLILDGIQDPQNLGACIRTANAAGVDAVIIPKNRSASVTSAVCKVASGAVESTPIITVTNLSRTLRQIQDSGIWVIGTDDKAEQNLYETDLNIPLAIILGAEGRGLRTNTRTKCDYLVRLPMHGIVESLNVSVAAGICLYEVQRQRRYTQSRR